jgi:hypothetical protein
MNKLAFIFAAMLATGAVTNCLAQDTIRAPWSRLDITGERMKPGFPFIPVIERKGFPWLPVGGGVIGGGILSYFLFREDEKPNDCSITATAQTTASTCGLANGSASIGVEPAGNYSIQWSNGTQGAQLSGVPAGSYTATIVRDAGCSRQLTVVIPNEPVGYTIQITTQPASCGSSDGVASAVITPAGSYTFQWPGGGTGPSVSGLAPGSYQLTVTLGKSCTQYEAFVIEQLSPDFDVQIETQPASCGLSDGRATATVTPAGNYTYQWSNGSSGPVLDEVARGQYGLTVTRQGTTCSISRTITIDEVTRNLNIRSSSTPAHCKDADGTATVTVEPPGNYTYQWSNGATSPSLSGVPGGSYTLTVTIAGSTCQATHTVVVETLPPSFTVEISTTDEHCDRSDGSATAVVSPVGSYSYRWSNGAGTQQITGLRAGNYAVTVNEIGTSCDVTAETELSNLPADFTVTAQTDPATCGIGDGEARLSVQPAGSYTVQWSNGGSGLIQPNLASGTYKATVSDVNECSFAIDAVVAEKDAFYVTGWVAFFGDCLGEGAGIRLDLSTPASGPMLIDASGPNGLHSASVSPGTVQLEDHFAILPGTWELRIRDSGLPVRCSESIAITVDERSDFVATDDTVRTTPNKTATGNVLANDQGKGLHVVSHTQAAAGQLELQPDGAFSYVPAKDTTGRFYFSYTVEDTCKVSKTQNVLIMVDSVRCNFTVRFSSNPAHCGLSDGSLLVTIDSPGVYSYLWSTGAQGQNLTNVRKGTYSVAITDTVKKCSLSFDAKVEELPAEYIRNIRIIQPKCPAKGDIRFEAFSAGPGPMQMLVDHPGGSTQYPIPKGNISLSTYFAIQQGEYTISVFDQSAGLDCMHSFTANIEGTTELEIMVEAVFPPSSPSASDGVVLLIVTIPGAIPYTVLLNNLPYQTAVDNFIEVGGLGSATYGIQLRDANGCLSNRLTVTVPPRTFSAGWGVGLNLQRQQPSDAEMPGLRTQRVAAWQAEAHLSLAYAAGGFPMESRLSIGPKGWKLAQDLRLWEASTGIFSSALLAGPGLRSGPGWPADFFLECSGRASLQCSRWLRLDALAALEFSPGNSPLPVFNLRIELPFKTGSVSLR